MKARFAGTCGVCGERFAVGTKIVKVRERVYGAWGTNSANYGHVVCGPSDAQGSASEAANGDARGKA